MAVGAQLAEPLQKGWPPRTGRLYLLAACAITLLAAALRLYKLGDANVWEDEAFTAWLAQLGIGHMLLATAGDTHPPLSYLLFHSWEQWAGAGAYGLRFLSTAFGVAAVAVVISLGRRLGGPAAGIAAGFLLATSRFHVWWSQQIRMYSLVALLGAVSVFCFLGAISAWKARPTRARWLLLAMAAANLSGLFSLYFFVLLILLESLFVLVALIRRFSRPLFAWWTAVQLASVLLFLPWLAYFRQHAITFSSRGAPRLAPWQFVESSWSELVLGIDTNVAALRPLNLLLAAVVAGLLAWLTIRRRAAWPVAWWLALLVAALPTTAYLITLPTGLFFSPTYQTRYQLMAVPALAVLVGWGISSLPKRLLPIPLLGFAALGAYTLGPLYRDRHLVDDYQTLARFVQAYEQPGDLIVFDPDSAFDLFLFQYRGRLPWTGLPVNQTLDDATTDGYFSRWTRSSRSLWLVQVAAGHDAGSARPVRGWLDGHLKATLQRAVGNKLVVLYMPRDMPPRRLNPAFAAQQPVSGVPGVEGFDMPIQEVRPGDVLNLSAYGQATARARLRLGDSESASQPLPDQAAFSLPINPSIPSGWQPLTLVLANGR
ncbi:MAG: glycosyltransferase family 39 protein, partial [Chloroflexota bacterium]|nr:glycosyltransferase family 39 protein [Chloroflexota bacterium]